MTVRMPEGTQPDLQELTAYLEAQPAVLAAVLFGSAAAGQLRPESDLDLALLFADDGVPDAFATLDLRAALEQRARRDVDLVVLNRAPTILAFQAVKKGQLIVCRDPRAYQRHIVRLISEYADFKRIRRPIEEAILKRRIYDYRDVVLAKVAAIQRCLMRIHQVTALDPARLDNQDIEDIFVLNLQRAVQVAIDLGAHVLAAEGFEMPATLREIFSTLEQHGLISARSSHQMQNMCGFRNIAVHDYQTLSKPILKAILTRHLKDLEDFYAEILARIPPNVS